VYTHSNSFQNPQNSTHPKSPLFVSACFFAKRGVCSLWQESFLFVFLHAQNKSFDFLLSFPLNIPKRLFVYSTPFFSFPFFSPPFPLPPLLFSKLFTKTHCTKIPRKSARAKEKKRYPPTFLAQVIIWGKHELYDAKKNKPPKKIPHHPHPPTRVFPLRHVSATLLQHTALYFLLWWFTILVFPGV